MPTFRPDLEAIPRYVPGRPVEEVARELGIDSIDKLASNECPLEPFPEVIEAIADSAHTVNRYPDNAGYHLTNAIAAHHGLPSDTVWIAAGSSENLRCTALAVGGPGTSAVFATPSFVMYDISTLVAGSEPRRVPLTPNRDHDLDAMLQAIDETTTVVYVCNPNNPTGGMRSGDDVTAFIDAVPERVTVVVDEAYAEYVTDPAYRSMIPIAVARSNVLVTRTFSKIYGLAGLRVGYAIGHPDLVANLRVTQPPFAVTTPGQVAAIAALGHPERVDQRRRENAEGRTVLHDGLVSMGLDVAASEANFVYFEPQGDARGLADALLRAGVIVRVLGDGIRVSVGTAEENARFLDAMGAVGA